MSRTEARPGLEPPLSPAQDRPTLAGLSSELQHLVSLLAEQWDESPQAVFCDDVGVRRIYQNRAFEELVGLPGRALIGKQPPYSYWARESWEQFLRVRDGLLEGRLQALEVRSIRGRFQSSTGRAFDVLLAGGEIRVGGSPIATFVFVVDLEPDPRVEASSLPSIETSFLCELRALEKLAEVSLRPPASPGWHELTQRERQVAECLRTGGRVPTIAKNLGISVHTVRNHLKSIFRKTGLRSQEELARAAELREHENS